MVLVRAIDRQPERITQLQILLAATFKWTYLGYAKFILTLGIKRLGRSLHLSETRSGAELFVGNISYQVSSASQQTYFPAQIQQHSDSSSHQRLIRLIINVGHDSRLQGVLIDMFRPHSPNAKLINLFVMVPCTPPTDR